MGKVKDLLDELDISEHALDGSPDEPSETDRNIQKLFEAVIDLEKSLPFGYEEELTDLTKRLVTILGRTVKPF